jgi:hypothetical protein
MTDAEGLAGILTLDGAETELWAADEMRAIWQHQLAAPLEIDLNTMESGLPTGLTTSPEIKPLLMKTFGELFGHSHPPVELLDLTRQFALQTLRESENPHLKQVAKALYYVSMAACLDRCAKPPLLPEAELRSGIDWALNRIWLDQKTKQLLVHARKLLADEPGS